jgi:hypothetical protein
MKEEARRVDDARAKADAERFVQELAGAVVPVSASTCVCPHCGNVARIIDEIGDMILRSLADWYGEATTPSRGSTPSTGFIDELKEPPATVYKTVLDLVENKLIESPGKVSTSLRGRASYYVLTEKGRKAVQQLRRDA